jgi:hypothetical protein
MLSKQQVRDHLREPKLIDSVDFKHASSSRDMPKFLRLKGKRLHHTDVMDAGGPYRVLFVWRDGAILEKRSFAAWLFLAQGADLVPVSRLDYHPSHRGLHVHVNCEDGRDLVNRGLPGTKILNLKKTQNWNPKLEIDRINLVSRALNCFGISLTGAKGGLF